MPENENAKLTAVLTEENIVIPTTEELDKNLNEIQQSSKEPEKLITTGDTQNVNYLDSTNEISEKPKELTEEEKRELLIKQLKESHIKFHPNKHIGNKTINQFGDSYKQKRKHKNKIQRKSRKANR